MSRVNSSVWSGLLYISTAKALTWFIMGVVLCQFYYIFFVCVDNQLFSFLLQYTVIICTVHCIKLFIMTSERAFLVKSQICDSSRKKEFAQHATHFTLHSSNSYLFMSFCSVRHCFCMKPVRFGAKILFLLSCSECAKCWPHSCTIKLLRNRVFYKPFLFEFVQWNKRLS